MDRTDLLGDQVAARHRMFLCEHDREDTVRAAAGLVHVGSSHRARLVALVHQAIDIGVRRDEQLGQVLHVGPQHGVLSHFEVALASWVQ